MKWPPCGRESLRAATAALLIAVSASDVGRAGERALVLKANMDVLRCAMPDASCRFLGSNAPGQVFLPGEPVNVRLALAKADGPLAIESQEITTRDPEKKIQEAFTDTAGHAPLIGLEGKSVVHRLKVDFGDKPEAEAEVEVKGLPVPERFGTYALVLVRGDGRQFLGTVARVPKPREDGTLENTPIFGEAAFFDRQQRHEQRAAAYDRMGVRGLRLEIGWSERKDGTYDWARLDAIFGALERSRVQAMVTLGAHPQWTWPFSPKQTPAVVKPNWDGNPYWGQCDWLCPPDLYPRYGKWITAFCQRYWKGGTGALWGIDNFNEPWEGGGISGWARDCVQYRALQKLIATSAWQVSRRIQMCAASSIMNTEDKLYSDGSREFDQFVDVFTDHYVVPPMCYGPLVAKAHGKVSVETETWFVNSEFLLPQVVQFLAAGQLRLSPWHPRVLFDSVPGVNDAYFIPTPLVAATAAFNRFLAGKPFERVVFRDHLPWVFQFGGDDEPEALLVVLGQLLPIAGKNPKDRLWPQVDAAPGGTLTVDNADGLLRFYDLAGNSAYVGQREVTLPMSIFPTYITCARGPKVAAERLKAARIEGKRPVEILPRDFAARLAAGAELRVGLHNCLNRAITGRLVAQPRTDGFGLLSFVQSVGLQAGETKTVAFPIAPTKGNAANAYPFAFTFASEAGNASYQEVMHAAIAPKGTKVIDGNLGDWADVPGVTVVAGAQKAELTELLRRPWLELADKQPDGSFAEFKLAWDERFLYVAARVHDPTPQTDLPSFAARDGNAFFHTAASDGREPYKTFLKDYPGRSFAEVPWVYARSPEAFIPFRRDRLHIALDVTDDWHDLQPTTDRVPYGLHAVPDTDYEYSLYLCEGGKSELWRQLAPGVPRIHDFPRQPRGERTTGVVRGAKHVVRRDGKTYTYELAIPREELAALKLRPGTTFGLMLRAGNNQGPHIDYGLDKAVTKSNGLTLHPYWERSSNCGVRWTLVE